MKSFVLVFLISFLSSVSSYAFLGGVKKSFTEGKLEMTDMGENQYKSVFQCPPFETRQKSYDIWKSKISEFCGSEYRVIEQKYEKNYTGVDKITALIECEKDIPVSSKKESDAEPENKQQVVVERKSKPQAEVREQIKPQASRQEEIKTNTQTPSKEQRDKKKDILKSGGSVVSDVGEVLEDAGEEHNDSIFGKLTRLAGRVSSSIGEGIEDVADDKKEVKSAARDSISGTIDAHKNFNKDKVSIEQKENTKSTGKNSTLKVSSQPEKKNNNYQAEVATASTDTKLGRYISLIRSADPADIRSGARAIVQGRIYDDGVLHNVSEVLLSQYSIEKGKVHTDAMAWLCNVLGRSGQKKYLSTLEEVALGGATRKLKKYAEKNKRLLQ